MVIPEYGRLRDAPTAQDHDFGCGVERLWLPAPGGVGHRVRPDEIRPFSKGDSIPRKGLLSEPSPRVQVWTHCTAVAPAPDWSPSRLPVRPTWARSPRAGITRCPMRTCWPNCAVMRP